MGDTSSETSLRGRVAPEGTDGEDRDRGKGRGKRGIMGSDQVMRWMKSTNETKNDRGG